jgi:hypothetical protein
VEGSAGAVYAEELRVGHGPHKRRSVKSAVSPGLLMSRYVFSRNDPYYWQAPVELVLIPVLTDTDTQVVQRAVSGSHESYRVVALAPASCVVFEKGTHRAQVDSTCALGIRSSFIRTVQTEPCTKKLISENWSFNPVILEETFRAIVEPTG